jgi:hypothetical protein
MGVDKLGRLGSFVRAVTRSAADLSTRVPASGSQAKSPRMFRYRGRGSMLSAPELVFYNVLLEAISGRFVVLLKVGILDLCEITNRHIDEKAFKRLASTRVDFLLCDRSSLTPLVAIELDDATYLPRELAERDALVSDALRTVGVALIRQRIQKSYDAETIARWIDAAMPRSPGPTPFSNTPLRPAS